MPTANFQVANIRKLIDTPDGEARTKLDAEVGRIRSVFEAYPLVPSLKAAIAAVLKNPNWRIVPAAFRTIAGRKATGIVERARAEGLRSWKRMPGSW